jgi:predicted DNA-binding protein
MAKDQVVWCRFTTELAEKLDRFCQATGQPRAVIIRAVVAKATLNDLPRSWTDLEEAKILALAER